MALWRFYDYYPEEGGCPISNWYDTLEVEVQAKFDAVVSDLEVTEDWDDEELRSFEVFTRKPEHLGMAQVRFYVVKNSNKTHYRAIGLWRKEQREFIFLTGFRKNGRMPVPENALTEAIRLRTALEEGRGETHEHSPDDLEEIVD